MIYSYKNTKENALARLVTDLFSRTFSPHFNSTLALDDAFTKCVNHMRLYGGGEKL